MIPKILLITALCVVIVSSNLTFKNVIVTCDTEGPLDDDIPFGTIVTTTRLQPHLPSDQTCFKISIQYSTIPILYSESLSDIDNAKFLLLENDNIEEVEPGTFKNVKLKEGLSLKSNKIKEIRRGVFNEVEVPVLFLSYNLISYIDFQAFDNMSLLESLHLDHNKLSRIDSFWFGNSPKLSKVNLQHNLITEVPANAFQNLNRRFSSLRIDLSHNQIRSVDARAFAKTKKLKFLGLAFNQLQTLDRNWLKGVKVDVLDISNNRFRCLSFGLAEPQATNLVDGNPWDCACLGEMKRKESTLFGVVVAEKAIRRCGL